ncbi:hypothetical protein Cadr_000016462 [Camelus dromedarius]|uniref:Uncharacterized protein n=1 Tax=Camelus dromedarius TaxID=9838 RepID=A0A5N4EB38_CAMDR|nr:hypothetical protein Cadr_000016462 [Camelus dromedarius]
MWRTSPGIRDRGGSNCKVAGGGNLEVWNPTVLIVVATAFHIIAREPLKHQTSQTGCSHLTGRCLGVSFSETHNCTHCATQSLIKTRFCVLVMIPNEESYSRRRLRGCPQPHQGETRTLTPDSGRGTRMAWAGRMAAWLLSQAGETAGHTAAASELPVATGPANGTARSSEEGVLAPSGLPALAPEGPRLLDGQGGQRQREQRLEKQGDSGPGRSRSLRERQQGWALPREGDVRAGPRAGVSKRGQGPADPPDTLGAPVILRPPSQGSRCCLCTHPLWTQGGGSALRGPRDTDSSAGFSKTDTQPRRSPCLGLTQGCAMPGPGPALLPAFLAGAGLSASDSRSLLSRGPDKAAPPPFAARAAEPTEAALGDAASPGVPRSAPRALLPAPFPLLPQACLFHPHVFLTFCKLGVGCCGLAPCRLEPSPGLGLGRRGLQAGPCYLCTLSLPSLQLAGWALLASPVTSPLFLQPRPSLPTPLASALPVPLVKQHLGRPLGWSTNPLEACSRTTGLWVWLPLRDLGGLLHIHSPWQHWVPGLVPGTLVDEKGWGWGWTGQRDICNGLAQLCVILLFRALQGLCLAESHFLPTHSFVPQNVLPRVPSSIACFSFFPAPAVARPPVVRCPQLPHCFGGCRTSQYAMHRLDIQVASDGFIAINKRGGQEPPRAACSFCSCFGGKGSQKGIAAGSVCPKGHGGPSLVWVPGTTASFMRMVFPSLVGPPRWSLAAPAQLVSGITASQGTSIPLPLPQTEPGSPSLEPAPTFQSRPSVGSACPICLGAGSSGHGAGRGRAALPASNSTPPPAAHPARAQAAGQPQRSCVHVPCQCKALSCLQGVLKTPEETAAQGQKEGPLRLLGGARARAPGHRLWPRCFPCVSGILSELWETQKGRLQVCPASVRPSWALWSPLAPGRGAHPRLAHSLAHMKVPSFPGLRVPIRNVPISGRRGRRGAPWEKLVTGREHAGLTAGLLACAPGKGPRVPGGKADSGGQGQGRAPALPFSLVLRLPEPLSLQPRRVGGQGGRRLCLEPLGQWQARSGLSGRTAAVLHAARTHRNSGLLAAKCMVLKNDPINRCRPIQTRPPPSPTWKKPLKTLKKKSPGFVGLISISPVTGALPSHLLTTGAICRPEQVGPGFGSGSCIPRIPPGRPARPAWLLVPSSAWRGPTGDPRPGARRGLRAAGLHRGDLKFRLIHVEDLDAGPPASPLGRSPKQGRGPGLSPGSSRKGQLRGQGLQSYHRTAPGNLHGQPPWEAAPGLEVSQGASLLVGRRREPRDGSWPCKEKPHCHILSRAVFSPVCSALSVLGKLRPGRNSRVGAQLGLEVAFWIPGLRAAGLLGPWGHGGDAWEGQQRLRGEGDTVSQTGCPGVISRGKGILTQNPTDLGRQEPCSLQAAPAAPCNGGLAEVGRPVGQSGEQGLEARGPGRLPALGLAIKGQSSAPSSACCEGHHSIPAMRSAPRAASVFTSPDSMVVPTACGSLGSFSTSLTGITMKDEGFHWGGTGSCENTARKTHLVGRSREESQVNGHWLRRAWWRDPSEWGGPDQSTWESGLSSEFQGGGQSGKLQPAESRFGPKGNGKPALSLKLGRWREATSFESHIMERIPNELCSGPGSQGDADALLHPDLVLLPLAVTASSSKAAGPRRLGLLGTESHNQLGAGGQIGTLLTLPASLGSCIHDNHTTQIPWAFPFQRLCPSVSTGSCDIFGVSIFSWEMRLHAILPAVQGCGHGAADIMTTSTTLRPMCLAERAGLGARTPAPYSPCAPEPSSLATPSPFVTGGGGTCLGHTQQTIEQPARRDSRCGPRAPCSEGREDPVNPAGGPAGELVGRVQGTQLPEDATPRVSHPRRNGRAPPPLKSRGELCFSLGRRCRASSGCSHSSGAPALSCRHHHTSVFRKCWRRAGTRRLWG